MKQNNLTPHETVRELDRYIVGQDDTKRQVAIALRNRYRRAKVSGDLREEIYPKNILMIGPTGVGKTEIARRLAKLVNAPFIKVEATKFTEVGYVGRDVESIIRDLAENSFRMVKGEHEERVQTQAKQMAEFRLVDLLSNPKPIAPPTNPIDAILRGKPKEPELSPDEKKALILRQGDMLDRLRSGEFDHQEIDIEVEDSLPELELGGQSIAIGNVMGGLMPKQTKVRHVKVKEALKIFTQEEAQKLIDEEAIKEEAVMRAEQDGIVFIDEIDKIAGRGGAMSGPDVSREGVQRDILPIVEGSVVNTKYGAVRTDYMLFIAAGAFHVAKISDLIPELQGRFPVQVSLNSLTKEDFVKILTQPENALTRQYTALLEVDKVKLRFDDEALEEIAQAACNLNEAGENLGARRLHGVFEELLEDISFNACGDEMPEVELTITGDYVREHVSAAKKIDLRRYIL